MTIIEAARLDAGTLERFEFRAVEEVGATLGAMLLVIGDLLGLYRALAGAGARTPGQLAARTAIAGRYVRERLNAQAAGGYVAYHPADGRCSLPPEQTVALTDQDSPADQPGFIQIALGSMLDSPRITDASRTGAGVGWHEHNHHVHGGRERFFRPRLRRPQAGPARIADVVAGGGLTRFRQASQTPFNLVYEARPESHT